MFIIHAGKYWKSHYQRFANTFPEITFDVAIVALDASPGYEPPAYQDLVGFGSHLLLIGIAPQDDYLKNPFLKKLFAGGATFVQKSGTESAYKESFMGALRKVVDSQ